jgi:hypothetical protein
MNTRTTLTIASLICLALLPELGTGGKAWAGFASNLQENTQPNTDWQALLPHLVQDELPPVARRPLLQSDASELPNLPMPGSTPKQETPGGSPTSSNVGGGPVAGLWSLVEVPADRPSALLFLDECSMREHSLSSRLFRPPRPC